MVGRDHAAEPVIVMRVRTISGTTRHVRADDLAAAHRQGLPDVPTCNDQGVRERDQHPGRPAFLHRVRVANIVQADALPPPPIQADPVQAQAAAPRAATAAGLVLDSPEEETEDYSASL